MIKFSLPFLPPSANQLYPTNRKTGRRFKSEEYKQFIKDFGRYAPMEKIEGQVKIEYNFYYPDLRVRDNANYEKALTDTIVKYGIIEDDKWMILRRTSLEGFYQKGEPETWIKISPIN